MTITLTFTDGSDRYVARTADSYDLSFRRGDDSLITQAGDVLAYLGDGNDSVRIDGGTVTLFGQAGDDLFNLFSGGRIYGGGDNDVFNVRGGSGFTISGGTGADRFNILVDTSPVLLNGGDGDDVFQGFSHSISGTVHGGAGNDRFLDFGNHDGATVALYGGAGNDYYRVEPGSTSTIIELAGEGTDTVHVASGMDYTLPANVENLAAGTFATLTGDAHLTGNELNNRIDGSSGTDIIFGLDGNDRLFGGAGDDIINGGNGDDRISGGLGADMLTGGAGSDTFVYGSVDELSHFYGEELITDWEANDRIDISAIDANTLVAGNQAFQFAGYSFGHPPPAHEAGTFYIGGFGGELWIIGYTDDDDTADFMINLWAAGGEGSLTVGNIVT